MQNVNDQVFKEWWTMDQGLMIAVGNVQGIVWSNMK